jgi:hypothetical protein
MVSFSNMDGAHCDSVVDHYTLPSNSIQMDVKVPVQPSNFDPLQKGALMGASTFMEQIKTILINAITKQNPFQSGTEGRAGAGSGKSDVRYNGHFQYS